ncbi:MAG: deoxyribonucleotide triphosphate pyrophosphatase [Bacteroidetes bacterium]|jgi:XTP/dITP diphosphohydrolase|nr:deoxyribonucleotide triphosphate pyrophosphatase [Bacteroidota bacterium]
MNIVFASGNISKIKEINHLLDNKFNLLGLQDIGCSEEIPETQPTIEGNASQKALYVYEKYHHNCFADDTGLEIEVLGGRPGVLSARYAGESKDANANMDKILSEMRGLTNRRARFKTVISLIIDGKEKHFEGVVDGIILSAKQGTQGFGYDPIFKPDGYTRSFAEMDISEKNKISHRAIAVSKLVEYLKTLQ